MELVTRKPLVADEEEDTVTLSDFDSQVNSTRGAYDLAIQHRVSLVAVKLFLGRSATHVIQTGEVEEFLQAKNISTGVA